MRATNQEVISNVKKIEYFNGNLGLVYGGKTRWIQREIRVIIR